MKKISYLFLCLCLFYVSCSTLTGYGRRAKPTAADSVQAIYDLYILGDTEGVSRLGLTSTDIVNARTAYDNALADSIRTNFSASGLEIDEESVTAICQARREALSRMRAECSVVSEHRDTAEVLLITTYFDEQALDADAAYAARDAANQADLNDYQEYMEYVMASYTEYLIQGYQDVLPSEDMAAVTVPCIIIDNVWMPADMSSFGGDLALAISGQTP